MFYILLLQTMTKRSIKSSGTGTKLALDPILFTPNGIFCKKTLDPSRPGNQPSYTIPNLAAGDGTHALPHCTSILYLPESFWFQSCIKNVIWKAKVEPPTKTWSAGEGEGDSTGSLHSASLAVCYLGCILARVMLFAVWCQNCLPSQALQVQARRYLNCKTTKDSQAEEIYTKPLFDARLR